MGLINWWHFIFSRFLRCDWAQLEFRDVLVCSCCVLSGLVCFIWKVLKVQAFLNNYTCC